MHCMHALATMHMCSHQTCLCSSKDEDAADVRGRMVLKGGAAAKRAKIIQEVLSKK